MRVEKDIFSLLNLLKETSYSLTIVTSEKDIKEYNYNNLELISFENYNDQS